MNANQTIQPILEEIGLAGNEAKVYLALLEKGPNLAGEITKISGVNRTNVYDALEKLTQKGLVSYINTANRKCFQAAEPKRFMLYLEDKQKQLEHKKQLFSKVLPELQARKKLSKQGQEATLYKGKKGLQSITEDVLNTKKELLVFGAEGKLVEVFKHYAEQWHIRRAKLNIIIKIIFNETVKKKKAGSPWKKCIMRFTKQEATPATTWVYGDKVAIIVWSEQPIATLLQSKEIADSYKEFFKVLWKNAKE
ncbi:hypothetical protein HYY69_01875 [Candidatus Woesearchaeota archaeon]|nr:hypothetical protein [Candidatus Woesearchaeota archaeon]